MNPSFTPLETVEIPPKKGSANMSVILLHGLGGSAKTLIPISKVWHVEGGARPRWILPQAPERPVSINNGQVMPAWYDIISIDLEHRVDQRSVEQILTQITSIIDKEIDLGIPPENILLAGFSQGGAVALAAMLAFPQPLAGVVCLSGYVLNKHSISEKKFAPHAPNVPIFYAHGMEDVVVPFDLAEKSMQMLKDAGFNVSWHTYPKLGHFVNNREILDTKRWIDETILKGRF